MRYTFHLDLDPHDADQRRVAEWLSAQSDPTGAIVRLVRAALDGEQQLARWEETVSLLADEINQMRARLGLRDAAPALPSGPPLTPVQENPESARRLDSMFA